MNRTLANVIIDLAAALLFVGMIATGYVLRFPVPPGTNRILTLWGLTRHQWGTVHFWISLSLLSVIAIHLVLHWKWVVTVVGKRLRLVTKPHPSMARSGMIVVGVFILAFALFAFAVHSGVKEMAEPLHELNPSIANEPSNAGRADFQTGEASLKFSPWDKVYTLLNNRCVSCHGPERQLGNFRADEPADYFSASNEQTLVVPGKSAESPLIDIVSGGRPNMRM